MYWTGARGVGFARYIDRRVLAGGGLEAKVCVRMVLLKKYQYSTSVESGGAEGRILYLCSSKI